MILVNYLELSIENVRDKCRELNKKIDFDYDLVIFIAKGSYIIGQELANISNVPLLEIFATRKGGKLKKILKLDLLIKVEMLLVRISKQLILH